MSEHHFQLDDYLKRLRLPAIRASLDIYLREANEQQMTYQSFLYHLLQLEVAEREVKKKELARKKAQFPVEKTLSNFYFERAPHVPKRRILDIAEGNYIYDKRNVIMIGNSGTGKTHLMIGLAQVAIEKGYTVKYYTAARLANEIMEAQDEKRLLQLEKSWLSADLVFSR